MENELRNKVKQAAKEYFEYINNKKTFGYIPPSGKVLGEEELLNMIDSSLDMWLTAGRFNNEFENEFKKYLNVNYCLTVNSGSSANLVALNALTSYKLKDRQIKKGDEVITVANGFPTTINPIIQLGLIPVFVDCNITNANASIEQIEKSISPKTKAIMLAHTLGNPFDIGKIKQIAKEHNLWIIEDNCDALGAKFNNQYTGTIGDIGTFSFYPAHIITMGEGGAAVTNNPLLYDIMRSIRDWGRDCKCQTGQDNACKQRFSRQFGKMPMGYDHKYIYSHVGYNLKLTDWQASIGCAQLKKVGSFIEKRRNNFKFLYEKLSDLKEYLILPEIVTGANPAWFGFLITLKKNCKFTKQEMVEYLEKEGIGTRQLFGGNILRQPYFVENDIKLRILNGQIISSKELTEDDYKKLPNTEYIMNNTFWVGVYPALDEKELDRTSNAIHKFINENT